MPAPLVAEYMAAFVRKDLKAIAAMLTPEVTLQDPVVKRVSGKDAVLRVYEQLFDGATFDMTLRRSWRGEADEAAQEFSLVIVDRTGARTLVEGIDLFQLRDGRIAAIRAYIEATPLNTK